MEEFSLPTEIVAGAGAVRVLERFGAKRMFLVTEPGYMKDGTARRIAGLAKAETVEFFDRVQPEPTVALAEEGTAVLKTFRPDLLVALGGGGTLDCAKAIVYFSGSSIPLAAIPTVSGSGSEVTDWAILTHGRAKYPLANERLRPDMAILDSDLLGGMSRGVIADGGFDLLTHAVEAYTAAGAGVFSDLYARESFRIAYAALPASYAGREDVRLKVHMASCMAGIAFSRAGLGICHAISHSLGGMFRVPHGRLNAVLLPVVIDCNAHAAGNRYAELARCAGLGGSTDTAAVRNLKNGLLRLRRELGLPRDLRQAGIPAEEIRRNEMQIVETVLEDPCCASNPVTVDEYLIRRILDTAKEKMEGSYENW